MFSTLLTLLVIGFFGWMFFKEKVEPALQYNSSDIEGDFISLKKKILMTDPYVNQSRYEQIYEKAGVALDKILDRHKHYILDWDASHDASDLLQYLRPVIHHNAVGAYTHYALPRDIDLHNIPNDTLLFICIMMYLGGSVKHLGGIEQDYTELSNAISYLADDVSYPPGIFFKGFMLKYGLQISSKPNSHLAREYLTKAEQSGVGAATIELSNIHRYDELSNMASVHEKWDKFTAQL